MGGAAASVIVCRNKRARWLRRLIEINFVPNREANMPPRSAVEALVTSNSAVEYCASMARAPGIEALFSSPPALAGAEREHATADE